MIFIESKLFEKLRESYFEDESYKKNKKRCQVIMITLSFQREFNFEIDELKSKTLTSFNLIGISHDIILSIQQ
jgi:hypothetical protein